MPKLSMPLVCECGFSTMDAQEAVKHAATCKPNTELEEMLWKGMAAAMDHLLGFVGSAQLHVQYGRLTGTASWYGGQMQVKVERV